MGNSKDQKNPNIRPKRLTLRVLDARKRDVGRSIIRIDTETMNELEISTGDIVEIIGNSTSAAIAWPSYPQDQGLGILRIDARLRKNIGLSIDDMATIRKADAKAACNAPGDLGFTSGHHLWKPGCGDLSPLLGFNQPVMSRGCRKIGSEGSTASCRLAISRG